MYERYLIIKHIYNNYLIILKKKDKIYFKDKDYLIVNTFKYKNLYNINKIILNNLEIEYKEEYEDNMYYDYLIKSELIHVINNYREELINNEK